MAFYGCTSLKTVVLHQGVKKIGSQAFYNCTNIDYVYCQSNTPPSCGSSAFHWYSTYYAERVIGCDIYVPIGSGNTYKTSWSAYSEYIKELNME